MHGKMAERSKACDSSESLPAFAGFSSGYPGVGSNPTLVIFLRIFSTARSVFNMALRRCPYVESSKDIPTGVIFRIPIPTPDPQSENLPDRQAIAKGLQGLVNNHAEALCEALIRSAHFSATTTAAAMVCVPKISGKMDVSHTLNLFTP